MKLQSRTRYGLRPPFCALFFVGRGYHGFPELIKEGGYETVRGTYCLVTLYAILVSPGEPMRLRLG